MSQTNNVEINGADQSLDGIPLKSLNGPFQVGQYGECQEEIPNLIQVQYISIRLIFAVTVTNIMVKTTIMLAFC